MIDTPLQRLIRRFGEPLILWAVVGVLAFGYVVQIISPLRLNNDSVRFLAMAKSALDGNGYTIDGVSSYLPTGYPALVSALGALGADKPIVLIAVNLAFILIGLIAVDCLLRWEFRFGTVARLLVHTASLANILFVNYAMVAQSEAPFFGLSMVALAAMLAPNSRRWMRLLLGLAAAVLVLAAIEVRTIGLALVPALLLTAARLCLDNEIDVSLRRPRVWMFAAGATAIGGLLFLLARETSYWYAMSLWSADATWIFDHLWRQIAIIGQAFLNLPNRLVGTNGHLALAVAGVPLLTMVARGILSRRLGLGPLELYSLAYVAIVFVWPYYQTRFWMPLAPILFAYLIVVVRTWRGTAVRRAAVGAFVIYLGLGAAGLSYSIWLSYSGVAFADRYGESSIREIYQAAFSGRIPELDEPNQRLFYDVLRHYEPLAQTTLDQPPK